MIDPSPKVRHMISNWLSPLRALLGGGRPDRVNVRRPLRLESLEERRVLTAVFGDDFGDTFADAFPVAPSGLGQTSLVGYLDRDADADVLLVHAPLTGGQSVRLLSLPDNTVDFKLEAFDLHGALIATNDNSAGSTDPTVTFDARANADYYVRVTGRSDQPIHSVGYVLQLRSYEDDRPSSPTAPPVTISGSAAQAFDGQIETLNDSDAFRFRAEATGGIVFHLASRGQGVVDPYLTITDSRGAVVGQNDNRSGSTLSARVAVLLRAGETYTVVAQASPFAIPLGTTGEYRLDVQPFADEAGTFREDSAMLALAPSGEGVASGTIGAAGDADGFRFVTPANGIYLLQINPSDSRTVANLSLANDRDSFIGDRVDTRTIRFEARAGESFLARVDGQGNSTFAYQLPIRPVPADGNNSLTEATPLSLDPSGAAATTGTLNFAGDVDFYRIAPTRFGFLNVALTPDGGSFPPRIQVYDAMGRRLHSGGSSIEFPTGTGETYFLGISATDRSVGGYSIRIGTVGDAVPNTTQDAPALAFSGGNAAREDRIDTPGDQDLFRIVAPSTGTFTIQLDSINGPMGVGDPLLRVLDSAGMLIEENDDSVGLNSRLDLALDQGQTYFVQAAAFSTDRGDYRLSIRVRSTVDDAGNRIDNAARLTFDPAGRIVHENTLQTGDDGDLFAIVAPTTGDYLFRLEGVGTTSGLSDPILTILDANGNPVAENDDAGGLDSRLTMRLTQGATYYVRAAGVGSLTGDYQLSITSLNAAPPANSPRASRSIALDANGSGLQPGSLTSAGQEDLYQFTAPFTGRLRIRQEATGTSELDSLLTVLTLSGSELIQDDDGGGSLNSDLALEVQAGTTYLVRAAAYRTSTGAYRLRFERAPDVVNDVANKRSEAEALIVDSSGQAVVRDSVDIGGDFDLYSYTATEDGYLEITLDADGSGLDAYLSVYDSSGDLDTGTGALIVENDDSNNTLNSFLSLRVVRGTTYYVNAAAYGQSTGNYLLTLTPSRDDVGDTEADSHNLELVDQRATFDGTLRPANDRDVFRFVAPATGSYVIRQLATGSSEVVPTLEWLDGRGNLLGDSLAISSQEGQLAVSATAGETVYFRVGRQDTPAVLPPENSAYRVTVDAYPDDAANLQSQATPISLSPAGSGSLTGTIKVSDDEDFYRFVASANGTYDVRMTAAGSPLDSLLQIYDANGMRLGTNDDNAELHTIDSRVLFRATAGESYFVRASASQGTNVGVTTGSYQILIQRNLGDQEIASVLNPASLIPLSGGTGSAQGGLSQLGATLGYRIVAPSTGALTVTVSPATGSSLDPTLSIYRLNRTTQTYELLGRNQNRATFGDLASEVTVAALGGESYFLLVESAAADAAARQGAFEIAVAPSSLNYQDDHGFAPNAATVVVPDAMGRLTLQGTIETTFDEDRFRFTAPVNGLFVFSQTLSTALDSRIHLFDSHGTQLSPVAFRGGRVGIYPLAAGETYDIVVGAGTDRNSLLDQPTSGGAYSILVRPDVPDAADTIPDAIPLMSAANGSAGIVAFADAPGDVDYYRYVATTTGPIEINLNAIRGDANNLDTILTVYDADGDFIADNDDADAASYDSRVILDVVQGRTYFIRAQGFEDTEGLYQLSVAPPDDVGGTDFNDARPLHLDGDQSFAVDTSIDSNADVDTFRFTAPSSGTLRLAMRATPGSALDPQLRSVGTVSGLHFATPLPGSGLPGVEILLDVTAGEVISIEARSVQGQSSGAYRLTATYLESIQLPPDEVVTVERRLSLDEPTRRFELISPEAGIVSVVVEPRNTTVPIQTTLTARSDSFGIMAASSVDFAQRNTQIQFPIQGGRPVYLDVGALAESLGLTGGDFRVRFQFVPLVTTALNPPTVFQAIDTRTNAAKNLIPLPGTTQVQSYLAPSTGLMAVEFNSPTPLNVSIFDSRNRLVATSGEMASQLTFRATARETYYVRVSTPDGMPPMLATYSLQIRPDDVGGQMDLSTPISLVGGAVRTSGTVNSSGDVDFYRSVATVTGAVTVRFEDVPGFRLNGSVGVYDSAGNLLGGGDRLATLNLTAGQEFFVRIAASETGKYDLVIDSAAASAPGDFSNPGESSGGIGTSPSVGDPLANPDGGSLADSVGGQSLGGGDSSPGGSNVPGAVQGLALFTNGESFSDRELTATQNVLNVASLEGTAELLVAVLLVGPDESLAATNEEEGEEATETLPDSSEEAIQLRLNSLANRDAIRSLRQQFDTFIERLQKEFQFKPTAELSEIISFLNSAEGREAVENAREILSVVDAIKDNIPSVGVPIRQFLQMWDQWFPDGSMPAPHPNAEPSPLNDLLIPDPAKLGSLPAGDAARQGELSSSSVRYLLVALGMLGMAGMHSSPVKRRERWLNPNPRPVDRT
jgi:hypothetical protein